MPHAFTIMEDWMLVDAYARACGVAYHTITKRIQRGLVCCARINGEHVINVRNSPPIKRVPALRGRYLRERPAVQPFAWPADMPRRDELVWVVPFVRAQSVRADSIYKALLFGEIPGWGVSGQVLVRRADALAAIGRAG